MTYPVVRTRQHVLLLGLIGLVVSVLPAWSQDRFGRQSPSTSVPIQTSQLVTQLVEQLGDARFDTRERATRRLIEIGSVALPALKQASLSKDRETRARAARALRIVFRRDLQQRRAAFLRESDSDRDFGLAGWRKFRVLVGDTPINRALFIEMHRSESELVQAVQQGPAAARSALVQRYQQLARWKQGQRFQPDQSKLSLGTVVALLFAVTDNQVQLRDLEQELPNYLFQQASGMGKYRDAVRRLLGHWVQGLEIESVYPALFLSLFYTVPEGLVPAEKVLEETKVTDTPRAGGVEGPHRYRLMFAIFVTARFGTREHLDLLEPLLQDASRTPYGKVEIRDLALAALLHLSGQNLVEFGFLRHRPNPTFVFEPNRLLFESPEARAKAIQRWRDQRSRKSSPDDPDE